MNSFLKLTEIRSDICKHKHINTQQIAKCTFQKAVCNNAHGFDFVFSLLPALISSVCIMRAACDCSKTGSHTAILHVQKSINYGTVCLSSFLLSCFFFHSPACTDPHRKPNGDAAQPHNNFRIRVTFLFFSLKLTESRHHHPLHQANTSKTSPLTERRVISTPHRTPRKAAEKKQQNVKVTNCYWDQ